jgi:AraC-like DNA-binding protein
MVSLIRTDDVPPAQRYEAWRQVVCETLGPLDFHMDADAPLSGEIEAGQLGALRVGKVRTQTPHSVYRTARLIRRDSPENYRVVLAMAGTHRLVQDDRAALLHAGELAIYDFGRPYELDYRSAVQLAVFTFPRALLPFSVDTVAALTATPMAGDHGTGAILPSLLRRVAMDLESFPPASAARLSTVVLDVVTTAIAERTNQGSVLTPQAQQRTLLLRIHSFIEQHLADPELSPPVIAAAHHISPRYLHRLFALDNTTVAGWIRQRRLERCRSDLADPFLLTLPVSAIAARRGLPDPAHFSRLFRGAYGLPPADYRRLSLAASPG